jgi:hypothetical protein
MNDKLQASLDAVDRLRGWAGQNGDDDAEAVSNALETQAAVIECIASKYGDLLVSRYVISGGTCFGDSELSCEDDIIAAAFKAVEEERNV